MLSTLPPMLDELLYDSHDESASDFNYIFNELKVVQTFGIKKSAKFWEKMALSWDSDFCNGAQGSILNTERLVTKSGSVGPEEIECQMIAASHGLAPKIYSAEISPSYPPLLMEDWHGEFEGEGFMRYGRILMERVELTYPDNGGLWEILPLLHKLGIAHRDLHYGNFGYNNLTHKHIFIDFGLATRSAAHALHEGVSLRDSYGGPSYLLTKNFEEKVTPAALGLGIDTDAWEDEEELMHYRTPRYTELSEYSCLEKVRETDIMKMIDLLYDGIA